MSDKNSAVAIVESHNQAEDAVREHQEDGFDRTKLPIAGKPVQGGVPMKKYWITAGVLAVLLVGLLAIPQLLQKWLWMRQLDYAGIFWTLLSVKWGMACVAFIGVFLFLWLNIREAVRNSFALHGYDTAKEAGSGEKTRGIEIGGFDVLWPCRDANPATDRGRRRCDRGVWLLYAMGHLSPLSVWRFLRVFRPCLRRGRGVLSLYTSVLSAPPGQSRIFDGAGDRWGRFPPRVLRANATQGPSTKPDLGECRSASFHTAFHPGRCRWMGLLPGSIRPSVLHDGRGLWSWIYRRLT